MNIANYSLTTTYNVEMEDLCMNLKDASATMNYVVGSALSAALFSLTFMALIGVYKLISKQTRNQVDAAGWAAFATGNHVHVNQVNHINHADSEIALGRY